MIRCSALHSRENVLQDGTPYFRDEKSHGPRGQRKSQSVLLPFLKGKILGVARRCQGENGGMCDTAEDRARKSRRNCVARLGGSSRISRNLVDEILLCSLQEGRSDAAPFHAVDNKLSPDEGSKGGRAELTSKVDNLSWTF